MEVRVGREERVTQVHGDPCQGVAPRQEEALPLYLGLNKALESRLSPEPPKYLEYLHGPFCTNLSVRPFF